MATPIFAHFVRLHSAMSADGKEYKDARAAYVGRCGLLKIYDTGEDKIIRMIFYVIDGNGNVSTIKSSKGEYVSNDEAISVRTGHSKYIFSKRFELSEDDQIKITLFASQRGDY